MLVTSSKTFIEGLMQRSWLSCHMMRMKTMSWSFHSNSDLNQAVRMRRRLQSSILLSSPASFQPNFIMAMKKWLQVPSPQATFQLMSFTTLHLWLISLALVNCLLNYSSRTHWSHEKISVRWWKPLESFNWDEIFLPFACMIGSGLAYPPLFFIPGGKNGVPISSVVCFTLCV